MIRTTTFAPILWILAASAQAAPPAASSSAAVSLKAGDTVSFDLSALPESFEGEAKATCIGTRIDATGPVESRCERTFRFQISVADALMTYVFKPAGGGGDRKIELPISKEKKPVAFVAPSAGELVQPAPTVLPPELVAKAARREAGAHCRECPGQGFQLDAVEVTRQPVPPGGALPVRLAITTTTPAAPK